MYVDVSFSLADASGHERMSCDSLAEERWGHPFSPFFCGYSVHSTDRLGSFLVCRLAGLSHPGPSWVWLESAKGGGPWKVQVSPVADSYLPFRPSRGSREGATQSVHDNFGKSLPQSIVKNGGRLGAVQNVVTLPHQTCLTKPQLRDPESVRLCM